MGETTTRHFRDKLAMRVKAQDDGLPVPAFVHVLNDDRIRFYNLPYRADYPEDDRQRWMVAGTPGANTANELARLGAPPERMRVRCTITMDEVEGSGHRIVASHLLARAVVPGADAETSVRRARAHVRDCRPTP